MCIIPPNLQELCKNAQKGHLKNQILTTRVPCFIYICNTNNILFTLFPQSMKQLFKTLLSATIFLAASLTAVHSAGNLPQAISIDDVYKGVPFAMQPVKQPSFPSYKVRITEFGAKNDGITLNTESINAAIRSVHEKGGGTVIVPAGMWLTGPIGLLSNVNLYTEPNALVIFTDDFNAYPIVEANFEGLDTRRCQALLFADNAENIAVTGHGVFEGQGDSWRPVKKSKATEAQWNALLSKGGVLNADSSVWYPNAASLKGAKACKAFNVPSGLETAADWESVRPWLRPEFLRFSGCKRVLIEGVLFRNSPCWTLHPFLCEDITINHVQVSNPWYAQNGDALDLDCCNRALVINNVFDAGDDGICIKSGKDEDGRKRGVPCQNAIIRNNTVLHGHGGFVIGSEMSGGVRNMYVADCTFLGTDVGLRFKSNRGRGGVVEDIYVKNICMQDIPNEAITFNMYYQGKDPGLNKASLADRPQPVNNGTPVFRNIHLSDITARNVGIAMRFYGLAEMPLRQITVSHVTVSKASQGILKQNAGDVKLENVIINKE